MKRLVRNEQGAFTVITVFAMVGFLAILALVVDFGSLYLEKQQLQKMADAAVLAGAQEMPGSYINAKEEMNKVIQYNNGDPNHFTYQTNRTFTKLEVTGLTKGTLYFANMFGITEPDLSVKATVELQPITSAKGAIPLGIKPTTDLAFGTYQTIKVSDSTYGNFGAIELTGSGANNYENDLKNGYSETLSIGQILSYENGKMTGATIDAISARINHCPTATYTNFPKDCKRVVLVPIIEQLDRKQVKVMGFATFFIEKVTSPSSGAEVSGRFINWVQNGESSTGQTDYGTYVMRLTQ